MPEKISATIEDYLGAIYVLEQDREPVMGTRLAELLGVTPPTVTNTLKRMARDGLVTIDHTHGPRLTEQGNEAARSVLRKHMLAEWLLSRMVSWSNVHKEAHELEHAISNEVEEALLQQLGDPDVCPHGNPLPGHEDAVSAWVPLTQLAGGDRAVLRRVHEFAEDNVKILRFLEEKQISPGQEIAVLEVLPFNQTITIEVSGQAVPLGFAIARYIFVEPAAA